MKRYRQVQRVSGKADLSRRGWGQLPEQFKEMIGSICKAVVSHKGIAYARQVKFGLNRITNHSSQAYLLEMFCKLFFSLKIVGSEKKWLFCEKYSSIYVPVSLSIIFSVKVHSGV